MQELHHLQQLEHQQVLQVFLQQVTLRHLRLSLISPTTRHLCHFGTETTIGNTATQDDMFIRFSDQENINDYTATAINSAGDFRLQDGTKIVGAIKAKETILVWTDNALYT